MSNNDFLDAPLTGDFESQIAEAIRRMDLLEAGLDEQIAQAAKNDAAEEEERARKARLGEMGPAWRTVQRDIDLGKTSVSAVLDGTDTSPAAASIREAMRTNAAGIAEEWKRVSEEDGEESPADEARGAAGESHAKFLEIQALIAAALKTMPNAAPTRKD